jgi:aryl-alcohol dehydrogenase-like predicted oxidoreductase
MKLEEVVLSRREALKLGLGAGALVALGPSRLLAQQGAPAEGVEPQGTLLMKPIPSTGEQLPVVGIGTARRYDVGESAEERAPLLEVLRELPRLGGRVVDTAPSYGAAESVLGDLIAELRNREELFIATKVRQPSREEGLAELERSLQRLRMERLDLVKVHNLVGWQEMLPVLRDWKAAGRIRYLGISTSRDDQYDELAAVMEAEALDCIQVDYALDNRTAEARLLPLARERGMAVFVNLPFGRGRVFERFADRPVPEWASELGIVSWAQLALAFVVSHPAVTCAIPGTATLPYARDNLGTLRAQLPDEAIRERMVALVEAE